MKRKHHLVFFIGIFIIIIFFLILMQPRGKMPFKELSVDEISEVSVHLLPPDVSLRLSEVDKRALVNILHSIVIYNRDDSYKNSLGQAVIYTISRTDGTTITINAYNPFLIIDGVGYKTKYEPCEQLSTLGNKAEK